MAAVAVGLTTLWRYQRAPGVAAAAPTTWPTGSRFARPSLTRPTVLMFIHPGCPCSRASLTELAKVVANTAPAPAVSIVFMGSDDALAEWVEGASWKQAERIPGAQLLVDMDGSEAARFGAVTSGQTLAYGADGRLLFAGGVTIARGEVGPSRGAALLKAALDLSAGALATRANVFGCPLVRP